MSKKQLHILASPGFLIALCVLLVNDFILKRQFHNALTGKLSDFAGLFVFTLFWAALFPRAKRQLHFLIGLLFVFWKSAYSQPMIDSWNNLFPLTISRIVDYGDLLALSVLPLSYVYMGAARRVSLPHPALCLITALSVFAFTATSYGTSTHYYDNRYDFQVTKRDLVERIRPFFTSSSQDSDTLRVYIEPESYCDKATIKVSEQNGQSTIILTRIDNDCGENDKQDALRKFEEKFIGKLRKG